MIENFKKILVLAPHTDDGEFGCGGTMARLIDSGAELIYVAFSICEDSVPVGLPSDILLTEMHLALNKLGLKRDNIINFNFPVRKFNFHRQEILEELMTLKNKIKPDLVLMPSLNDIHQDHRVVAEEGVRAFKNNTILSYELLWNVISFENTCFVHLSQDHIEKKINAILEYKSQTNRGYSSPEFIRSQSIVRGVQVRSEYAEVFEVVRIQYHL